MATPTTEPLAARLKALILGQLDMATAHEAASYLLGEHADAPGHDGGAPVSVRRAIETGLVVTYARPFVRTRRGTALARARDLSPELAATHDQLLELRNEFFAHNDDTPWRKLRHPEDVSEPLGWPENLSDWIREGGDVESLLEQWTLPTRLALEQIRQLAEANHARFTTEKAQIVDRLRADQPG